MLSSWSFSVLLLSSVFGSPVNYTNTSNSTSECPGPSCNQTFNGSFPPPECHGPSCNQTDNDSSPPLVSRGFPFTTCSLPTCAIHDIDKGLTPGDEKAGGAASDPFGPGKK
ncbi:uncharacterized protein Hap1MRO34_002035 isoform 2-T2 [Clarias gariepinus]